MECWVILEAEHVFAKCYKYRIAKYLKWMLAPWKKLECLFVSWVRWLTHTGREVSPSGLKPNSRISTGDPLQKSLTRGRFASNADVRRSGYPRHTIRETARGSAGCR
jgi:hypothetical protein